MKKTVALILSVMMVFGAMGGVAVSAASPSVVSVSNIGDVLSIADNPGATYNLINDIDMSGFGMSIPSFSGTFNGNGYQIKTSSAPLFGVIESGAVVQDLYVMSKSTVTGEGNLGIIAGTAKGTIRRCAAVGNVEGLSAVGVLAGLVSGGTVSDCYSIGSAKATGSKVGGLVGSAENAVIERCYTTAKVSGTSVEAGGLVGSSTNSAITNCYASFERSGQLLGVGVGSDPVTNLTESEIKSAQSFDGFDFSGTWMIIEGDTSPRLISINGMGTSASPYRIHDAKYTDYDDMTDLIEAGFGSGGRDVHYRLESDIIGRYYSVGDNEARFNGVFDGNNHVFHENGDTKSGLFKAIGESGIVKNLIIESWNAFNVDVFGFIANVNYGTVENCHVYIASISGGKDLGGIVGENINGTVRRCSFSGTINSSETGIGGIVGYNSYGTISECSVKDGYISAHSHSMGGIVGDNTSGIVENSMNYNLKVDGKGGEAGGIAGRVYNGTLRNCYANQETTIYGENVNGGIAGVIIENGQIENCYYNSEKTAVGVGSTEDISGALTSFTAKNTGSFAGFDFANTWTTDEDGELALVNLKGEGTAQNPYIIRNCRDWNAAGDGIGADGERDYYKINNNLYSSVIKSEFMGSLNGGGHVVTINLPMLYSLKAGGYIGNVVFLNNDDDWTICDAEGATIDNCSFIGTNSIGVLSTASNTKISNCGVTVDTDSSYSGSNEISGGLVGQALNGTAIDRCYVRGAIVNAYSHGGGLVGINSGSSITNCYVYDTTVSSNNAAGGFAGRNDNGGTITNCYTNAIAKGENGSGAFVGMNYAKITNIFADDSTLTAIAAQNDGTISGESLASQGAAMPREYIQAAGTGITVSDTTVYTPTATTAPAVGGLTDISGHWAEQTIKNLVSKGVVNGYEDNTYRPEDSVTKGEYIKLLMSVTSRVESTNFTQYRDVNASWAKGYVSRAIELGLCDNINSAETEFGVDEPITRAQAAALMGRLLKPELSSTALSFADTASIPDWAQEPVLVAVQLGLIAGNDDGTFRPMNNLTRAEAATIIERILNL